MLKFHPVAALVPPSELAGQIACPPYDVMSTEEARSLAAGEGNQFLPVVRPEVQFDPVPEDSASIHRAGREMLDRLISQQQLVNHPAALYLYRQTVGEHQQTGLVGCYEVEQYREGLIRKHELTRPDKEDDRVEHMLACEAQPEPVLLTFNAPPEFESLLEREVATEPIFDFVADDGISHTGWRIDHPDPWLHACRQAPAAYIADGHHRTAAADRVAAELGDQFPEANRVLSVLVPADQLRILGYHRLVRSDSVTDPDSIRKFLGKVGQWVDGTAGGLRAGTPFQAGEMCIYLEDRWHRFRFLPELLDADESDLTASLDVSLLQNQILRPLFGIDNPRTDPRISFVGGSRGIQPLQQAVDTGEATIAFSMFPTRLASLFEISDAGQVMPPKSTWFDPKLRSGLFVHRFQV